MREREINKEMAERGGGRKRERKGEKAGRVSFSQRKWLSGFFFYILHVKLQPSFCPSHLEPWARITGWKGYTCDFYRCTGDLN